MPDSLRAAAVEALSAADLDRKVLVTRSAAAAWRARTLSLRAPTDPATPTRPGRPEKPELVAPRLLKKRNLNMRKRAESRSSTRSPISS